MRPAVHHHGGGRHGDDGHTVANAGLQAVVPLVVGHGEQPWGGGPEERGRIRGGEIRLGRWEKEATEGSGRDGGNKGETVQQGEMDKSEYTQCTCFELQETEHTHDTVTQGAASAPIRHDYTRRAPPRLSICRSKAVCLCLLTFCTRLHALFIRPPVCLSPVLS